MKPGARERRADGKGVAFLSNRVLWVSVQCSMFSVQCSVFSVQCKLHGNDGAIRIYFECIEFLSFPVYLPAFLPSTLSNEHTLNIRTNLIPALEQITIHVAVTKHFTLKIVFEVKKRALMVEAKGHLRGRVIKWIMRFHTISLHLFDTKVLSTRTVSLVHCYKL